MKRSLIAGLFVTTLAACGGGTSQVPADRAQAFVDNSNAFSAAPLTPSLPTTGGARYGGQLGLNLDDPFTNTRSALLGDVNLNVNFQNRNVSGQVSNMIVGDDGVITPVTGRLSFAGSTSGPNRINLELRGPLTIDGVGTGTVNVPFSGVFKGVGAVPDSVGGTTGIGRRPFIETTSILSGAFVAIRRN
jgi:hypothetical protein